MSDEQKKQPHEIESKKSLNQADSASKDRLRELIRKDPKKYAEPNYVRFAPPGK